jgi:hypothetical protein
MPDAISEFDLAPLALSYRPDLGVLNLRWLRDVSFEELQTGFRAAAALSQTHHATRWLVDVRRRTLLDAFQSEWVAQQQLPEVAATLAPAALSVAYLLSPARFENLRLQPALDMEASRPPAQGHPYQLRTFVEEGQAMQWLLDRP